MLTRSRHEGDTVDLLQVGRARADQVDRGFAQEARAIRARGLFELPDRRARDDHLAQLVVEHHDLRDRAAALVTGAAALPAAAPGLEAPARHGVARQAGSLEILGRG